MIESGEATKETVRQKMSETLAETLRVARERCGMSRMDVERKTGYNNGNLWRIEESGMLPRIATLRRLCSAYGMDFEETLRIWAREKLAREMRRIDE